jgi:hypothetical protein
VATTRNKHNVEPYINTVGNPGVATGWGGYRPRCRSVAPKHLRQATLNLTRTTTHTPHPATRHPTHQKPPEKAGTDIQQQGVGPPYGRGPARRLGYGYLPCSAHCLAWGTAVRPRERDTVTACQGDTVLPSSVPIRRYLALSPCSSHPAKPERDRVLAVASGRTPLASTPGLTDSGTHRFGNRFGIITVWG